MLDLTVLSDLLTRHQDALGAPVRDFALGDTRFEFSKRRYLTGVINLSVDSWYTESIARGADEAVNMGLELARDGAHLVDIGAESTLPDAARHGVESQIEQLLPVVRPLAEQGVLVSVESYHPEVLEACAKAGAKVFNLTGTVAADEVLDLAAKYDCGVILCYVQGDHVREVGDFSFFEDMVPVLTDYFTDLLARAERRGVTKCFVDPGLGFYYKNLDDSARRVTHQMNTFLNCFRLHALGYPTFNILPHAPEAFGAEERRAAEPFFGVLAVLGGTHMIRTHEVRKVKRVLDALGMYRR